MGASSKRLVFLLSCLVAFGIFWSSSVAGQEGRPPRSSKISPILTQALDRMERAGVRRETMASYDLEQFSNRLVRVDRQGRIQVYIHVDRLDDAALSELRSSGVVIDRANLRHGIVQGWVPFDLVEQIAQMPNVRRIRPPDYAVPRGAAGRTP